MRYVFSYLNLLPESTIYTLSDIIRTSTKKDREYREKLTTLIFNATFILVGCLFLFISKVKLSNAKLPNVKNILYYIWVNFFKIF